MPGGSISISDSHSETESLLPPQHGKEQSDKPGGKQSAPATKPSPRVTTKKESQPILSNASSSTGKSQAAKAGKTGKAKPGSDKSPSRSYFQKQLTTPLLDEVSGSWDDTEYDVIPLFQNQNTSSGTSTKAQAKVASKPVFKSNPSSSPASSDNKPPATKKTADAGTQIARTTSLAIDDYDSSIVESSSGDSRGKDGNNRSQSGKPATSGAPKTDQQKINLSDLPLVQKIRRRQSQGGLAPTGLVEAEIAKRKKIAEKQPPAPIDKATLMHGYSHVKELTLLMSGENTNENAEAVYKKVAEICTDPKLGSQLKLSCLLGKRGQPCKTLQADVNAFFDKWVIEKYIDNHAPQIPAKVARTKARHVAENTKLIRAEEERKRNLAEEERKRKLAEEERIRNLPEEEKKLLLKENKRWISYVESEKCDDEKIGPDWSFFSWRPEDEERETLKEFKATLNWWERRKINNIRPAGLKGAWYVVRKRQLQRIELLRKMQKRLTVEERAVIREETRVYHDILANSGLPLLHIAIKNESVELVRAYLLAVTAFAPCDIKKEAIQATQHQNLQAFYYAMTHSTTTMIKMFMETVLYSAFISDKDKEEILHARRPDKLKNGTFGISAFYMAMALGDIARADIFMSTLLRLDPNCEMWEYSKMKERLLLGQKSFYSNDTAKYAAREHGHKKLVKRYDKYINSSLLSTKEKDGLYICVENPIPELKEQPKLRNPTEKERGLHKAIWKTLEIPENPNEVSKPVKISKSLSVAHYTKRDNMLLCEAEFDSKKKAPKDPEKYMAKKPIQVTFEDLKDAGNYAQLSTFPTQGASEKRRTDGDMWIGVLPATSRQARKNTWEARAANGTLPPRSSSYASGLVRLPTAPSSFPVLPRINELTPKKSTPNSERRTGQQNGLPNRTPTRLVSDRTPKSVQSRSDNSPGRGKDLRKQQASNSKAAPAKPIPT